MISRRNFLGGILATACAPAIVQARSLMPIRPSPALVLPSRSISPPGAGWPSEHALDALRYGMQAFGAKLELYTSAGVLLASIPTDAYLRPRGSVASALASGIAERFVLRDSSGARIVKGESVFVAPGAVVSLKLKTLLKATNS